MKLSTSQAKGRHCPRCQSRDVRGQPSPLQFKRSRSFACGQCGKTWTDGSRR